MIPASLTSESVRIRFVSCLALLSGENQNTLISGGGDGFVRFWNPESGQQITCEKTDISVEINNEEKQEEDVLHCPAISCLACCQNNSVVCAVLERCPTLRLYHTNEKVTTLPSLETEAPPWTAVFDPEGRLWSVQPHSEEPVLVFEPRGTGSSLTYVKLSSDFSPVLSSARDWSFLKGCVNQERKLETLRKKEVDNISEYLARKEDRIEKKRDKSKQSFSGDSTAQAENGAKRPRLES